MPQTIAWSDAQSDRVSDSAAIRGGVGNVVAWTAKQTLKYQLNEAATGVSAKYIPGVNLLRDETAGIAIAGRSVYYSWVRSTPDLALIQVCPFMPCVSVAVRRDASNLTLWYVDSEFATKQYNNPVDPSKLEPHDMWQSTPDDTMLQSYGWVEEVTVLADEQQVLWEDYRSPTPLACRLPTGNRFSQPFITPIARKIYTLTQLEEGFNAEKEAERLNTCNESGWDGEEMNYWRITKIDWQDILVPYVNNQNILGKDCQLVTYQIESSGKEWGWLDRRALIDTHHLKFAGITDTRTPNISDEGVSYVEQYTDRFGTLLPDQDGLPDYQDWEVFKKLQWSFLRKV